MRLFRCTRWLLPALMFLLLPIASFGQVMISVTVAPPPLPVYEQPLCPEDGWMWSPGYWAWGDDGYYWVPGEWVPAPYAGALWTPPWWGWDDGHYIFHNGYWGDEVGYYGGIDYGYGYMGVGFVGGEWRDGAFAYNTAVMRVNTTVIHNTYVNENIVRERTVVNDRHVAYNGGPGGIRHDPTPTERSAMSARHTGPTQVQMQHVQSARSDRTSYAKVNGGHPHTLAMARPAEPAGAGREANRPGSPARTAPVPQPSNPRSEPRTTEPRRTYPESRPPASRPETSPAPEPRPTPRTEPRSAPPPSRPEARPEPRPSRPQSEPRPMPEPQPQPRTPERPHAESPAATPPRTESRPAPESRPQSRPESRPAERPATRPESRPAPPPPKPKEEPHQ